ncbi:CGNR zinc finger domain-containing protein [Micromonospora olivasterospora]|uniref:Putative RNA-binding Zn ribbon-like protein n=1 Tax=Micromonospora olivasterospora TaxID=1880 RepID=A0A562I7C4_MICOL|nr:ABATE domain-containing protein [Micromonospora olivasterospora]TWH66802.1 putative RNA-binding Zn ribbon-like protein [Micromonospora olivasterospora]
MADVATGLTLTSPDGTRYHFDPGALCLEFLTTGGPGPLARHEILHRPADLAAWLALSRLRLDPGRVAVRPGELANARRLRDALWRLACARTGGRPPTDRPADFDATAADLATLNEAAAAAPLVPELTPEGTRRWVLPARAGQALAAIAQDAVDLFGGPYADRIRECSGHDCYLVFVDTSRPGRRRWCAMERCGNRHKVRSLRARRAAD